MVKISVKGLPGTNTVAYYEHSLIKDKNSFTMLSSGTNVMKFYLCLIKEC
jgi:hypothetical protein